MRRLEIITGSGRRRRLSVDDKARIVEETLLPARWCRRSRGVMGCHRSNCSAGAGKRGRRPPRMPIVRRRGSCRLWWRADAAPVLFAVVVGSVGAIPILASALSKWRSTA